MDIWCIVVFLFEAKQLYIEILGIIIFCIRIDVYPVPVRSGLVV